MSVRWPARVPARARERPLPFVTRQWARYLELLEQFGADLGGDELAIMAAHDELADQLAELIRGPTIHERPRPRPGGRNPMTNLRYFGAYDASSVGIATLHVACDGTLDAPDVLLRATGTDVNGDVDFDHLALTVAFNDLDALTHALGRALASGDLTGTGREDAHALLDRVQAARRLTRNEARLRLAFHQLAQGERLQLADDGRTTFAFSEIPPEVAVHRWGEQIAGGHHQDRAILTALYDLGLETGTQPGVS